MKTRILFSLLVIALLAGTNARTAAALSRPEFVFSAGKTFGADGQPADGGYSAALSPMWPVGDHARFGVSLFADDVGSTLGTLFDPNDHTELGTVGLLHRWAWGGAWRGDVDVARRGRWTAAATGTWGWWRIEDDRRGDPLAAASAVGVGAGLVANRRVAAGQELGLSVRWQRLFAQRNSTYHRVEQYATAALEWSWAGAPRR